MIHSDQNEWSDFLLWETTSRDTIDFKTIYVDMAGDLIAGLMLSQIIYWYLPSEDGSSKLRVCRDSYYWIAKAREDWWDEIRISKKQVDRALQILYKKGIIITALYKFNGAPTTHIRIDKNGFLKAWNKALSDLSQRGKTNSPKGEKPVFSPNVEMDFTQTGKSLTEITTEITTETTENKPDFDFGLDKYWEHCQQTDEVKKAGGNYAVPPDAGGAEPFAAGPVDAFCQVLAGIEPFALPPDKRLSWARKLRQIAADWSTETKPITAAKLEQAIRAVPDSDIGWKTYTSPYAGNFALDIGPLVLDGGQVRQKGGSRETRQRDLIAPGAAPRRVATKEEARRILGR